MKKAFLAVLLLSSAVAGQCKEAKGKTKGDSLPKDALKHLVYSAEIRLNEDECKYYLQLDYISGKSTGVDVDAVTVYVDPVAIGAVAVLEKADYTGDNLDGKLTVFQTYSKAMIVVPTEKDAEHWRKIIQDAKKGLPKRQVAVPKISE